MAVTAAKYSTLGHLTVSQVRSETASWIDDYNLRRPHESLGDLSPIEFLSRCGHAKVSIYAWP
jgi:putative transposase